MFAVLVPWLQKGVFYSNFASKQSPTANEKVDDAVPYVLSGLVYVQLIVIVAIKD